MNKHKDKRSEEPRIDPEHVEHIAFLTRLALTETEAERFSKELSTIIEYFDLLGEAEIEGVPPACQSPMARGALRADAVAPSMGREDFLTNAPAREGPYVKIPVVLGVESEPEGEDDEPA